MEWRRHNNRKEKGLRFFFTDLMKDKTFQIKVSMKTGVNKNRFRPGTS